MWKPEHPVTHGDQLLDTPAAHAAEIVDAYREQDPAVVAKRAFGADAYMAAKKTVPPDEFDDLPF